MDADLIKRTADRLRVRVDQSGAGPGKSGSGVYRAEREDGGACVLKITARTAEDGFAGRRELDFYRELSDRVPIRTPTLLGHVEDDEAIALLLSSHGTVDPPTDWDMPSWEALALDLARLHRTEIAADRWRPASSPWHALEQSELDVIEAFWRPDFGRDLDAIVEGRLLLEQQISNGGEAFLHGDCHTDNVLRDGNGLVWIDWQSVTVGSSARELAFVQARATPSGTTIPPGMLTTYCCERGVPFEPMQRAVLAAELSILIFEWPPYAVFDSLAGTQRVRSRARQLADLCADSLRRR